MQLHQHFSLKPYHTFGMDVYARSFARFHSIEELEALLSMDIASKRLILGGGSNLLFTQDYDGFVLKNELHGIEVVKENAEFVYLRAGAGENWHKVVMHCVNNNWGGLENLSLIPGNVGASPMQNIGAYGVEIKDVMEELEAFHIQDRKVVTFTNRDCAFGYRESVFKQGLKNQFVILNVTYKLKKDPVFHTSYGAINQELERMGVHTLSIRAVSDAVIRIRSSKLPNPAEIGNAGSFFKNPQVSASQFHQLKSQFPSITGYPLEQGSMKIAAGWLIEHCGPSEGVSWKGYRKGDAGCHALQALVLVNYGHAQGMEVFRLSEAIVQSVKEKFGIELEREVNIV
jgi:UDP-N-acetylmuramate dehydrogenase